MGHVLGLLGSARRWGNSELLVRQVLAGAQVEGATAAMIRLTSLHVESCTGCLRCVLGRARGDDDSSCSIDDDLAWLVDRIQEASGLVLAAPTYFLGPAAVIKLVLDRLLTVLGSRSEKLTPLRPAITIATAGLEGWRGVTLPYLNALAFALGFAPIESLTAIAPGPGEILLDASFMAQVLAAGHRLGRGDLTPSPVPRNVCPVCCCDAFVLHGRRMVCPICGLEGKVEEHDEGLRLRFPTDLGTGSAEHRWTPENLERHMVEWVMATGPRFMARRREIREAREPLRSTAIDWLCPPTSD